VSGNEFKMSNLLFDFAQSDVLAVSSSEVENKLLHLDFARCDTIDILPIRLSKRKLDYLFFITHITQYAINIYKQKRRP
jgi:hypothetical protein